LAGEECSPKEAATIGNNKKKKLYYNLFYPYFQQALALLEEHPIFLVWF
jgi:hypothetical protein